MQSALLTLRQWIRVLQSAIQNGARFGSNFVASCLAALGVGLCGAAFFIVRMASVFRRELRFRIRLDEGFSLTVDLQDALQLYLFLFGTWEPSTTSLIKSLTKPGRCTVDVGAHIGYFSILAASLGADVVAFEADPDMADRLLANISESGYSEIVRVVAAAVADDSRGRTLHRGPNHNRGLTSSNPKWNLKPSGPVPSISLSNALSASQLSQVQIVKIDVEGSEPEVIAGMGDSWRILPPDSVILIELSPKWWSIGKTVEEVLLPIREAGFEAWTIENSYSPFRLMRPKRVQTPKKLAGRLSNSARRYDLVFARSGTLQANE